MSSPDECWPLVGLIACGTTLMSWGVILAIETRQVSCRATQFLDAEEHHVRRAFFTIQHMSTIVPKGKQLFRRHTVYIFIYSLGVFVYGCGSKPIAGFLQIKGHAIGTHWCLQIPIPGRPIPSQVCLRMSYMDPFGSWHPCFCWSNCPYPWWSIVWQPLCAQPKTPRIPQELCDKRGVKSSKFPCSCQLHDIHLVHINLYLVKSCFIPIRDSHFCW